MLSNESQLIDVTQLVAQKIKHRVSALFPRCGNFVNNIKVDAVPHHISDSIAVIAELEFLHGEKSKKCNKHSHTFTFCYADGVIAAIKKKLYLWKNCPEWLKSKCANWATTHKEEYKFEYETELMHVCPHHESPPESHDHVYHIFPSALKGTTLEAEHLRRELEYAHDVIKQYGLVFALDLKYRTYNKAKRGDK